MKVTLFALALLASAVIAGPSGAAARQPIVATALAVGTMNATLVHATTGAMVLDQITIAPGGNFGWHTHGSPVAVVVTGGTLTVFDPSVGKCTPFTVSKGQSFVEPANHIHLARNDTTKPVTLYAMYLSIPKNAGANVPAKQPAGCSA
jgi:quercetin dioxygenase-like cupin family protein